MKKWEITLGYGGQTITVSGIYANDSDTAQQRARSVLAVPACWDVAHVAEVVAV